jgi:hypothetical protein
VDFHGEIYQKRNSFRCELIEIANLSIPTAQINKVAMGKSIKKQRF